MRDYELYSCTNRRPKMRVWIKEARENFTKLYCTEPELWERPEEEMGAHTDWVEK